MNLIDLNNRNAVVTGGARHSLWGTAAHMLSKTRWAALGTKNEAAAIFDLPGSHAAC